MKMLKTALLGACVMVGSQAGATAYDVTLTGFVRAGYGSGYFGPEPTLNQTFLLTYHINDDVASAVQTNSDGGYGVSRGVGEEAVAPVTADLTINGKTVHNSGGYLSQAYVGPTFDEFDTGDRYQVGPYFYDHEILVEGLFQVTSGNGPLDYRVNGEYDVADNMYVGGEFNYTDIDIPGVSYLPSSEYEALTVTHISTSVISAVPEPASWVMMISGVGFAGGVLRRKGRAQNVIA